MVWILDNSGVVTTIRGRADSKHNRSAVYGYRHDQPVEQKNQFFLLA